MARENPMTWLDVPLVGYRGEPGPEEASLLPGGSWYFDRRALELVYLPRQNRHLEPDSSGRRRVRFRLELLRAQAGARKDDPAMIGLRLVPVEAYRWFRRTQASAPSCRWHGFCTAPAAMGGMRSMR
jgi:hypothetical protein